MRKYGYGRVSEKDQNEDRQLTALREQGIPEEYIFIDKASGKNFDRPEYQLLKRVMREGDTLFVKSINRFGRNKQEILKEWQWLIDAKIHVVVIDIPILDTRKYVESYRTLVQLIAWKTINRPLMKQNNCTGVRNYALMAEYKQLTSSGSERPSGRRYRSKPYTLKSLQRHQRERPKSDISWI